MNSTNLRKLLIVVIVLIAGFLRFYSLHEFPVSLYWDETAQGYNAYSISQTGKDEFGSSFPLFFRSFDDNKMPVYIYLTAVVTKIFGLNEFTTRFISAIAGTLTVFFTILITEVLLLKGKFSQKKFIWLIGLFSGLLLAISPWHLQFSRAAFEANLALTFIVSGTYYLLIKENKQIYIYLSAFLFVLAVYSYRSVIVFLPLFLFSYVLLFKNYLFKANKKRVIIAVVLFLIAISPLIYSFTLGQGDKRAAQVSVFSSLQDEIAINNNKQIAEGNTFWAKVKYNRRLVYAKAIMNNYISHFKPDFLFLNGDGNARHTVNGMGVMYKWEVPFLIFGIFSLYFFTKEKKFFYFIIFWLLISPIPASITIPAPHALRSLLMLPIPQILTAIGLVVFITRFKAKMRILSIILMIALITYSFMSYTKAYATHLVKSGDSWGDGYKQLVNEVNKLENKYDKVLITGEMWEPYIYFLYYLKYDPIKFQQYGTSTGFSKYIFGGTSWDLDKQRRNLLDYDIIKMSSDEKLLLVFTPEELSKLNFSYKEISKVKDIEGKPVFILLEPNF